MAPHPRPPPLTDLGRDVLLEIAKYIHVDDHFVFAMTCCAFADVLRATQLPPPKKIISHFSAALCSLPRLKWAVERGFERRKAAREFAVHESAARGKLELLVWLHSRDKVVFDEDLATNAASSGDLPTLQFVHTHGAPLTERMCAHAARNGRLQVLRWARAQGAPWDTRVCSGAASGGHLEVLRYARSENAPWKPKEVNANAAGGGHLEVLRWAREQGAEWDERVCANAATGGQIKVLRWARAQGAPWNSDVTCQAAYSGHLEVLRWAHEQGAEWHAMVCILAAQNGNLEMLRYARANGAPWDARMMQFFTRFAPPEVRAWLVQQN
jgi:hypothetical protein